VEPRLGSYPQSVCQPRSRVGSSCPTHNLSVYHAAEFEFLPNAYFEDEVLTKKFRLGPMSGPEEPPALLGTEETSPCWKAERQLTMAAGADGRRRPVGSFFWLFEKGG
jgi:hypothetical protein